MVTHDAENKDKQKGQVSTMDNTYYAAEIMKGRRRRVFLFEVEKGETLEEVVERNFGADAQILQYRFPTPEEKILMSRGMKS